MRTTKIVSRIEFTVTAKTKTHGTIGFGRPLRTEKAAERLLAEVVACARPGTKVFLNRKTKVVTTIVENKTNVRTITV